MYYPLAKNNRVIVLISHNLLNHPSVLHHHFCPQGRGAAAVPIQLPRAKTGSHPGQDTGFRLPLHFSSNNHISNVVLHAYEEKFSQDLDSRLKEIQLHYRGSLRTLGISISFDTILVHW